MTPPWKSKLAAAAALGSKPRANFRRGEGLAVILCQGAVGGGGCILRDFQADTRLQTLSMHYSLCSNEGVIHERARRQVKTGLDCVCRRRLCFFFLFFFLIPFLYDLGEITARFTFAHTAQARVPPRAGLLSKPQVPLDEKQLKTSATSAAHAKRTTFFGHIHKSVGCESALFHNK